MKFDLHLHSNASDGDFTPTQIVRKFKKAGYRALALCDHDTIDGIPEFLRAGKKYKIMTIPGVEMSSVHNSVNVHIAGLGINHRHRGLRQRFARYRQARRRRARKIVSKLKDLGFKISYNDVQKLAHGVINRPHIASVLISHPENEKLLREYVTKKLTISHVIQGLIYGDKPAYVAYQKMKTKDDIKLIHQAGGIAIHCHPWYLSEVRPRINQEKFIKSLKRAGVDGIEAYPKPANSAITKRYRRLAKKYNLILSAGSDFHGPVHNHKVGGYNPPRQVLETILDKLNLKNA